MRSFGVRGGMLFLRWEGTIDAKMVADISAEFDQYKRTAKTVTFSLSSCGGSTHHMNMAINLLNYIKATHPLTTMVERGGICGSACVAVFLAGSRRIGALASLWFFHPARRPSTKEGARGGVLLLPEVTDNFITRYFVPAGVSPDWIQFMRRTIRDVDLWQTGRDLWEAKSGILTEPMSNLEPREEGPVDLPPGLVCGSRCRG
jgi:hypothetical protein